MLRLIINHVNIGRFLKNLLDDNKYPIYMKILPKIEEMRYDLYCRLFKNFYKFKESSQLWN